MKIIKQISLRVAEREQREFAKIGLDLQLGNNDLKIEKTDARWDSITGLLDRIEAFSRVYTEFSKSDLKSANYLGMYASVHSGYPQPEDDFGYLKVTYDLSNYCTVCGVGAVQKAPFRLKRAPVWGKKEILQLNWVFDQFFVTPSLWEILFKPFGIGRQPVLLTSGAVIDSVVQVEVPFEVPLEVDGYDFEVCSKCNRKKYTSDFVGYEAKPISTDHPYFHSTQDFGSGSKAFKLVRVSNKFYMRALEVGLKGVEFSACEL